MSWIDDLRSANWNQAGFVCLFSYVLGCFTAGYYLARLHANIDIREVGSGSVGARNVGRVLGRPGFFLTVLFDFLKGALAVWTARHFTMDDRLVAVSMLAVVGGHIWPAQLRFRGGKGMATCLGGLLVYDVRLALCFGVLVCCLAVVFWRLTLPAAFALACLPLAGLWFGRTHTQIVLVSILAALVLFAHRRNLADEFYRWVGRDLDAKPDRRNL